MYIIYLILFLQQTLSKRLGVIEINRHGARTPKNFTSISSPLFFGSIASQLTFNGYNQHLLLGEWVAENYKEIIPKTYNPEHFQFLSSPIQRTIFSAIAFIKGMYHDIEVIPIVSNSTIKTNDIPPIAHFNLRHSPQIANLYIELKDSLFHASKCKIKTGPTTYSPNLEDMLLKEKIFIIPSSDLKTAVDDIIAKVPGIAKDEPNPYRNSFLSRITGFIFPIKYHYGNLYNLTDFTMGILRKEQINKFYTQRLLDCPAKKLITSHMYSFFQTTMTRFTKEDRLRYALLSGHDTNIADILSTLMNVDYLKQRMNINDKDYYFVMPPFASSMFFEIHSTNESLGFKSHYVKIFYNGEEIKGKFADPLKYDDTIGGIYFNNFIDFLNSRIDSSYTDLVCDYVDDNTASINDNSEIDTLGERHRTSRS
jgi:hypothetical protein